ncbi:C2 domain-containing protein 3-like isoform X2 [Clavelina lepadiformis]|uniref:C2 domain-containing protein 3-like isoform X2 n=1 Tax=Clavelina lepadiformis TaxID=159417 RepID=UPI004042623B
MDKSEGRGRRRRRAEYVDVVPTTDLPPLVEGELRCFLFVTIGKLVWGSIVPSRTPPASPAYIRLRWWGEASDGTIFRPEGMTGKCPVRSRGQFCVRSGPKQIAAYFNDMGSATFDVLSSPKSLPIGRVQVPGVGSLSSDNPIRGYFPIISASSRKLGELHVSMSFKSLKGAFDNGSDTATDGSMSARSFTASGGRNRRSRSRASSIGSARSRSSSRGSIVNQRFRSRSNSSSRRAKRVTSSGRRSRSRSVDSKASAASQRSRTGSARNTESVEIPTPRGIDALLERNGHDLYAPARKDLTNIDSVPINTTVSSSKPTQSVHYDAISDLLSRGKRLRDEITQSATSAHSPSSPRRQESIPPQSVPLPIQHPISSVPHPARPFCPQPSPEVDLSMLPQICRNPPAKVQHLKTDPELRIVDMVLRAKGIKPDDSFYSANMSDVSSPPASMVSDLDDPLHDQSILQHLFYQHQALPVGGPAPASEKSPHREDEKHAVAPTAGFHGNQDDITQLSEERLRRVHLARVFIRSLQFASSTDSDEETSNKVDVGKKGIAKWKKVKPPAPAMSSVKKKAGTFFVEYKFPFTSNSQRHPSMTSSSHEVTRVASRKSTAGGLVKFDQHSVFSISFDSRAVTRWSNDNIEFVVYHRKPKDKKALVVGVATLPLRYVIESKTLSISDDIDVVRRSPGKNIAASLKVSVELAADTKDLPTQMSPVKKPRFMDEPTPYTVTKILPADERTNWTSTNKPAAREAPQNEADVPRVCIVSDAHMADEAVCPRVASALLYLYIVLKEARDIPATRVQCGLGMGKLCTPNVYLVCRTFASDDVTKTGVVWNTSNPKFDFSQVSPVKIDPGLFARMRDNFMVVEVWTRVASGSKFSDKLMGLAKISLHLFYQSLKDPEIARAVLASQYPLISVDGFQPIVDLFTGQERGKIQVLLALGSQAQINSLRKVKEFDKENAMQCHHLAGEKREDDDLEVKSPRQHSFEVAIDGLRGFNPPSGQSWGEGDCFIEYNFPTQRRRQDEEKMSESHDGSTTDEDNTELASMQSYRTSTTLCVPDPKFEFVKQHLFLPPPSIPIQRIILSACSGVGKYPGGGIPFEVWTRSYYPNVRDQLLAKGCLPAAKVCALVTMRKGKASKEIFQVPLEFVDPVPRSRSAGDLSVTVKYKSSGECSTECNQPPLEFSKTVKLQVAVLQACGLKAAARLAASVASDSELEYCAGVGVNSYVVVKPSFLPQDKPHETRCVARTFTPDYNHHFELSCPVVSYHESVTPIGLSELLADGCIEIEIWHKPAPEEELRKPQTGRDVLLGRARIPTCGLLTRTTGCSGWYPITSLESLRHKSTVTIGAVELEMTFSTRNDLELVLRAAKAIGWKPKSQSELSSLLVPDLNSVLQPIHEVVVSEGHVTTCITITNAWLPKHALMRSGFDEIDKRSHIYVRYKFYDNDSVTSSLCPVIGHGSRKPTNHDDVISIKLAHRKSFLCRPTQPFVWYLREERLELQVWLSNSRTGRSKRPLTSDRLLGSTRVGMSGVLAGGLHKQQHISGLFHLHKAGVDDLGEASIRVYLSVTPGDQTRPHDDDDLDESTTTLSSSSEQAPSSGKVLEVTAADGDETKPKQIEVDDETFSAVVSVERAMHLPPLSPSSDETNSTSRPSCYITYPVAASSDEVVSTKVVPQSTCPVWEDAREVKLERKLLLKVGGNLLFRVWHRAGGGEEMSDRMIGFVTVDLSILNAGFRAVNGWYNILDIHGNCQGQLKVAITPTSDFSELSRKIESSEFISGNRALHSVPLLGPVETPSGSMYYPGVKSSQQTVGSTCTMSDNMAGLTHLITAPSVPMPSLLKRNQKSCLLGTLQRQMQELDEIKKNFEQRRITANYFIDHLHLTSLPTTTNPTYTSVTSSMTSQVTCYAAADGLAPVDISESEEVAQKYPTSSVDSLMPSSGPKQPTVHMSLFKPGKDAMDVYEDAAALSDNELSDLEFVQPKNLNTQSALFAVDAQVIKVDLKEEDAGERPLDDELSRISNNSNSEVSETNNTSLWLSASTSRIGDVSIPGESPHIERSEGDFPDLSPVTLKVRRKDVVERDPVLLEDQNDFELEDVSPGNDGSDAQATSDPDEKSPDADLPADYDEAVVSDADVVSSREDGSPTSVQEEHAESKDSSPTHDELSSDDEDDGSTDKGLLEEVESDDGQHPDDTSSDKYEEEESPGTSSEVEGSDVGGCSESSFPQDQDQVMTSSAPLPSSRGIQLPSFFPPRQDLVASMRALQAITTEQQQKLLRSNSSEDKENSASPSTGSKSRRKITKPTSFTKEQTERLARIFNTKYTSS